MRSTKDLLLASHEFASDQPWRSWWCLVSTLSLFITLIALAASGSFWPFRAACGGLAGLAMVRLFIIYHDHQHGTILRGSTVARFLMWLVGMLCLSPTSVWKRSHDHHHRHNSREFDPNIGSFRLMTVAGYEDASWLERYQYRVSRHPLTFIFGYLTIFAFKMCLAPFLSNPRRHFDCALALVGHAAFAWLVFPDWQSVLLAWVLPFMVSMCLGAYLFFAQHNFPGVQLRMHGKWDYVFSALQSSSYLAMGPVMSWFTGNIGYHHVHHLNAKIPFYRLPEAMAAIEELQSPKTTTLAVRDVVACMRLKLWDTDSEQLVYWPNPASRSERQQPAPPLQLPTPEKGRGRFVPGRKKAA